MTSTSANGEDLAYESIDIMNNSLQRRGKKLWVDQVANALIGPEFIHPQVNEGNPYTLTKVAVISAYAHHLGGGRSLFKVAGEIDNEKTGRPTLKTKSEFTAAGFKVEWFNAKKNTKRKTTEDKQEDEHEAKKARLDKECVVMH